MIKRMIKCISCLLKDNNLIKKIKKCLTNRKQCVKINELVFTDKQMTISH